MAYWEEMHVRNLYTLLKGSGGTEGVYSLVGPAIKPNSMVDSYFKTPYHTRTSLSPEGEFSQQMMGVKAFKPWVKKVSYFS